MLFSSLSDTAAVHAKTQNKTLNEERDYDVPVEEQMSDTNRDIKVVPLTALLPGERARIVALEHGGGRRHRFRTMGMMEGKIVEIVATQPARGPVVINVEGTQIAIGRGMARRILIEKI